MNRTPTIGRGKAAPRALVLEDGSIYRGYSFGSTKEAYGEVVFSTAMTGYQEALTDPSYRGQILTLTYPLVGNYGINPYDSESKEIQVRGFVVNEACATPSNWRATKTLHDFLNEHNTPGIQGIDTRALTIKLREHGTMRGKICKPGQEKKVAQELSTIEWPDASDLVQKVTTPKVQHYNRKGKQRIVLLDIGAKQNAIQCLTDRNAHVIRVPATTGAAEILKFKPHGLLVSSGPGDPTKPQYVIETVRSLFDKLPMFGICLGNQILALAAGAKTYKLHFGHRGLNHPVQDRKTKRVFITTQNHGYSIDPKSLTNTGFKVSQVSLNDASVEGLTHTKHPIFSVQYHPEAAPGPKDNEYLFDDFLKLVKENYGH